MRSTITPSLLAGLMGLLISTSTVAETQPFSIAIHGGAGTISKANLTEAQQQA